MALTREGTMHKDFKGVVVIGVPLDDPAKMAELEEALKKMMDATWKYVEKLAHKLHISVECAIDVVYLRGRSRWTPALEKELIRLHRAGTPPLIFDFGVSTGGK